MIHPKDLRALKQVKRPLDSSDESDDDEAVGKKLWKKNTKQALRLLDDIKKWAPVKSDEITNLHLSNIILTIVSYDIADAVTNLNNKIAY